MKDYGSKKKKKYAEYKVRKLKRDIEKKRIENFNNVMNDKNSTIEDMARVIGIQLK